MIIPTADDLKTVTDMREDAIGLLNLVKSKKSPTIIMHRNTPQAVLLSVAEYNKLTEMIEDYLDERLAVKLEKEPFNEEDYISIDEVEKELGINV